MMFGRTGNNVGPVVDRVTKNAGHNRFVWDVRHRDNLSAPPGPYAARVRVGTETHTTSLNVLIDPRIAAEGVTVADLREQFEHNRRMRAMVQEVGRMVQRVNQATSRLRTASGAAADTLRRLEPVAVKLITEPVRYGKPGLQAHITYLAGMTANVDMKIGRDAIERQAVLRRELDAVKADLERVLGPDRGETDGRSGGPGEDRPDSRRDRPADHTTRQQHPD
jgi:hypothetical protein